ncbi:MAG: hypothetical protein Q7S89_02720 [bacterium]|nr:hypothetical protein [bacterium]
MDRYSSVFTAIWHVTRLPALYWKVSLAIVVLSAYALFPQVSIARLFNDQLEKQEYGFNRTLPEVGYREPTRTKKITVTAYSSTPDQTDSTPFITANGTRVRDGIIAANSLPFGTRVRFPNIDPEKIYVVHDRMHPRFSQRADIWMASREEAIRFGAQYTTIEIW